MAKRARHDLPAVQDKRAKVVELRAQGWTWDQIAAEVGYSGGSAASKAWHVAIRQRPDQAVDKIRAEAADRLEYLYAENVKLISDPGPRVSAIGKVAVYPDGHPRAGEIIEDQSVRARALDNARRDITDYVRLTGAELTPQNTGYGTEFLRMYAEICAARGVTSPAPPPPPAVSPIPLGIASAQADASIAQLRARHAAEQLAAATPQPGDDDIAEAEIVS